MRFVTKGIIIALSLFCAISMALAADQAGATSTKEKLMNPKALNEKAPDVFQARFDTSKGVFVIEVTRAWAPNGADRFYNLVKNGFYDNCRFFRVMTGFMAQFGISGDPSINPVWSQARIQDDPVKQSNKRSFVSYAMGGPNTRTTQLFINYDDRNSALDKQGFSPFGKVIKGMDVVDSLYSGYGDGPPEGKGPDQSRVQTEGNAYLTKSFARLDYIKTAVIVTKEPAPGK